MNKRVSLDSTYITEFGNNYWEIIHLEALKLTFQILNGEENIQTKRAEFLTFFEYIIKNLMCSCKNHAYQIFIINKPDNYKYMLQYTIDFHNQVNVRLNKSVKSYDFVLNKYKKYIIKINQ